MSVSTTCGDFLSRLLDVLNQCIEEPDLFLQPQSEKYEQFKEFTKSLYDLEIKIEQKDRINRRGLPRLLTDGFDEEGIWQQIHLQNVAAMAHFQNIIASMGSANQLPYQDTNGDVPSDLKDFPESDDEDIRDGEDYAFDDEDSEGSSDEYSNFPTNASAEAIEESGSDDDFDSPIGAGKQDPKYSNSSTADDIFFNLESMEQYLNTEDLKEMRKDEAASSDESEDINLFEDIPSDDSDLYDDDDHDDDDEEEGTTSHKRVQPSKDIMYSDFFDPPASGGKKGYALGDSDGFGPEQDEDGMDEGEAYHSNDSDGNHSKVPSQKKVKFALLQSDSEEEEEQVDHVPKTAFEKLQEKEKKKIREMEESLLQPKPWQLTGEVAASSRPEDSLVYQPTEFDATVKQDKVTTEELTGRIEQFVISAVLNKAWNDCERKVKPKEDVRAYKRPVELEQTKSKKGLAEVYEEDYLKLHDKSGPKEDPKHLEIKKLMDSLIPELNALFAFIPKPPVPEITVVNNMPAVSVEEVAPVALSDGALLAPEEIKKKSRGNIKGKMERTITDRKRERRKKKLFQKYRQKKLEEKMTELSATSSVVAKKHEKMMALKKLKQNKNARIISNEAQTVKSSKDFFSRLQDTVQTTTEKSSKHNVKRRKM